MRTGEIVRDSVPGCELQFVGDARPTHAQLWGRLLKDPRALPNFAPQWTARKGAAQLYKAYSDHGISLEEIEGYRYRRLGQIKHRLSSGDFDGTLRRKAA